MTSQLTKTPQDRAAAGAQRTRALFIWIGCFVLFRFLAPLFPTLPQNAARDAGVALFLLLSLMGPRVIAPLRVKTPQRLLLAVLFALLTLGFARAGALLGGFPAAKMVFPLLSDLSMIGMAGMVGQLLAGLLPEANLLVPIAVVCALVDYWGVYYGTTKHMVEKLPQVVSTFSVQVPSPAAPPTAQMPQAGFGDFMFLTFFLATVWRFGLRERLTFWVCSLTLVAGMGVVLHADINVPALLPMAVGFLLANVGCFRFKRSEALAMLYAAVIVAALVGLVVFLRGR